MQLRISFAGFVNKPYIPDFEVDVIPRVGDGFIHNEGKESELNGVVKHVSWVLDGGEPGQQRELYVYVVIAPI